MAAILRMVVGESRVISIREWAGRKLNPVHNLPIWTTSDAAVCRLDELRGMPSGGGAVENLRLSAVAPGTCDITATAGGLTETRTIVVAPAANTLEIVI